MKTQPHILVIRLSAMGDVAMTVPVLRAFSYSYPHIRLTVVTRSFFKPLFDDIPNCEVLEADVSGIHKGVFGMLKLSKEAKKAGINAVADLHGVIRSKIMTAALFFQGKTIASIHKGRKQKKALTRAEKKKFTQLPTTFERYADVFRKLGYPIDIKTVLPAQRKPIPQPYTTSFQPQKKLIGIAPFATYPSKMYPLQLMKEVIYKLDQTGNFHLLLFGGGKKEIDTLSGWEKQFSDVINIAGTLSFKEELALISNLDVMLSMDSGNGHLAAIFGVPVITLWGVTHPFAGFAPFNQPQTNQLLSNRNQYPLIPTSVYGNTFPENYNNVMVSIPVDQVVKKVLEIVR